MSPIRPDDFRKLPEPTEQLSKENFSFRQLATDTVDTVMNEVIDLTNPKFERWYRGAITMISPTRFLELAAQARKGFYPKNLFSFLLKEEMTLNKYNKHK